MTKPLLSRRRFISGSVMALGTAGLPACGGGGTAAAENAPVVPASPPPSPTPPPGTGGTPSPAPAPAPTPVPSPPPPAPAPSSSKPFYVLETGVGYDSIAGAVDGAAAGQTIVGVPGTYVGDNITIKRNLTLKSSVVGVKVVIDASTVPQTGQAGIFQINGVSVTFEDFEITGNKQEYGYAAGVTTVNPSGSVTLRRCKIHECSNGVLGGNQDDSTVWLLENCEFANNGSNTGLQHQLYLGHHPSVTLRGCWVHNTKNATDYVAQYGAGNEWRESWGHLVKSRSKALTIQGCRLTMERQSVRGGANRCIDYSNGGDLTVYGNLIEYRTGQNNGQGQAISWGIEGINALPNYVLDGRQWKIKICQNTIVARSDYVNSNTNAFLLWVGIGLVNGSAFPAIPAPTQFDFKDNVCCGWLNNPPLVLEGGNLQGTVTPFGSTTYAISNSLNTVGGLALLSDAAGYDYSPVAPVAGSQNWTALQYSPATSTVARTDAYRGAVNPSVLPSWVKSVAINAWGRVPLANAWTDLDPKNDPAVNPNYPRAAPWSGVEYFSALIADWCGGVTDLGGKWWNVIGGGHAGYGGNELYQLDLSAVTPSWTRRCNPSGAKSAANPNGFNLLDGKESTGLYADGRARPGHTWNVAVYDPVRGPVWPAQQGGFPGGGGGTGKPVFVNKDTGEHTIANAPGPQGINRSAVYDPVRDRYLVMLSNGAPLYAYTPSTQKWASVGPNFNVGPYNAMTYLPDSDCLLITFAASFAVFDLATNTYHRPTFNGTPALDTSSYPYGLDPGNYGYSQPVWVPSLGAALAWNQPAGATTLITKFTPGANPRTDPWTISTMPVSGANVVTPGICQATGTYGRWFHWPAAKIMVLVQNQGIDDVYFYRYA